MATIYTSRVFAAIEALYLRLGEQTWTQGTPGGPVDVLLGDTPTSRLDFVRVEATPSNAPDFDPRASRRVNETFTLRVQVFTGTRHKDALSALRRLRDMCDIVQHALRDSTTGAPLWLDEVTGLGREVIVAQGASLTLAPTVGPLDGGGFGGEAFIDLQLVCVI